METSNCAGDISVRHLFCYVTLLSTCCIVKMQFSFGWKLVKTTHNLLLHWRFIYRVVWFPKQDQMTMKKSIKSLEIPMTFSDHSVVRCWIMRLYWNLHEYCFVLNIPLPFNLCKWAVSNVTQKLSFENLSWKVPLTLEGV